MLARSSTIRHRPSGVTLQTPLLVPSFSSKGFSRHPDGRSEIADIFTAVGEFLTEAFLLSAYDIHYGHMPGPEELPWAPEMIFLDSGGYEVSTDRDYSSVIDALPAPEEWSVDKWEAIAGSWPEELPVVVVSYDHHSERLPFLEQAAAARQRFRKCPAHIHAFLIKPETHTQGLLDTVLKLAAANVGELGGFDIVGLTEKELGRTMLDRMVQIATLRLAMDQADLSTVPLHIFGALDPLSVCLYYISGAEIFDGLTWIRYGYHNGLAVYRHNLTGVKYDLNMRDDALRHRTLADNYYYLQSLERQLRDYEATQNFEKLEPHADLLKNAKDSLTTRMKRRV